MRLVDSSEGEDEVRRTNEMVRSDERLGRWVALSEAVVDQLRRCGRTYETSSWLSAPPREALAALNEWVVASTDEDRLSQLPPQILDEHAARTPLGESWVERVRRALPIAWVYQVALWADHGYERRQDFESLWRELDEFATEDPLTT